jgi:Rho-binding antiterminator
MPSDYTPISCDNHDILELAIMHGDKLRVKFRGHADAQVITPLSLRAAQGEEFLRYRGQGGEHEVRLDELTEFSREAETTSA